MVRNTLKRIFDIYVEQRRPGSRDEPLLPRSVSLNRRLEKGEVLEPNVEESF